MAVSVVTDLVSVSLCESLTDNGTWYRIAGTSSANPAADSDAKVQSTACVANKMGATTNADVGGHFNSTATHNFSTSMLFYWRQVITSGNMLTKANAGIGVGVTTVSTTTTSWAPASYKRWNIDGSDTAPISLGWVPYILDMNQPTDTSAGVTDLTVIKNIAFICKQSSSVTTTMSNQFIDGVRRGTGITVTTTIGSDIITLNSIFTEDNNPNNRWGVLTLSSGIYSAAGKIRIGSTGQAQACLFTDTSQLLIWRQNRVADDFNEIALSGASGQLTTFTLTDSVVRGAKWTLTAGTNTVASLTGCSLSNLNTATLTTASSLANSAVTDSGQITSSGADLSGASFSNHIGTQLRLTSTTSGLSGTKFTRGSGGHAIEITVPGTYTFSATTFSGYGADGTATAAVYNNSGGLVTINVSGGGGTPTYLNGAGASTVINNSVSVTISTASGLTGAEIRIYDLDNSPSGSLGTELDGVEINGSSTFVYSGASGNEIWIQIMKSGYKEYGQAYIMPAVNSNLTVLLILDNNA